MGSNEEYQLLPGMEANPSITARRAYAQWSPGDKGVLQDRGRGAGVRRRVEFGGRRKLMENKQEILDKLLPALQATRLFRDLVSLEYEPEQEMVTAVYNGGATLRVNVSGDSGFTMIKDVLRLLA